MIKAWQVSFYSIEGRSLETTLIANKNFFRTFLDGSYRHSSGTTGPHHQYEVAKVGAASRAFSSDDVPCSVGARVFSCHDRNSLIIADSMSGQGINEF